MDNAAKIISDRNEFIASKTKQKKRNIKVKVEPKIITVKIPTIENLSIYDEQKATEGYVYFIYIPTLANIIQDAVKIGMTKDLNKRMASLQTGNPYRLQFYKVLKCVDYKKLEVKLHRYFDDKKILNEWFDLTLEDIDDIIIKFDLTQFISDTPK